MRCALKKPPSLRGMVAEGGRRVRRRESSSETPSANNSQQRVRRPDQQHLPAEDVLVVDKAGREALDRVLLQLYGRREAWKGGRREGGFGGVREGQKTTRGKGRERGDAWQAQAALLRRRKDRARAMQPRAAAVGSPARAVRPECRQPASLTLSDTNKHGPSGKRGGRRVRAIGPAAAQLTGQLLLQQQRCLRRRRRHGHGREGEGRGGAAADREILPHSEPHFPSCLLFSNVVGRVPCKACCCGACCSAHGLIHLHGPESCREQARRCCPRRRRREFVGSASPRCTRPSTPSCGPGDAALAALSAAAVRAQGAAGGAERRVERRAGRPSQEPAPALIATATNCSMLLLLFPPFVWARPADGCSPPPTTTSSPAHRIVS